MRLHVRSRIPGGEPKAAGKLNLLLSGFWRQDVVPTEDIVRCLDLVPGFHLEGLREIVYLPEFARAATALAPPGMFCSGPVGEFIQEERRIFVYGVDDAATFFHMLYHEIGHFVFYLALGSRVKKRWVTQLSPGSVCVTPYAARSPSEDFAETYAFYLCQPHVLLKELPQKHAFMRDCVFSGAAGTLKERVRGPSRWEREA